MMECPTCKKFEVLLKVVQSADRRHDIELERNAHVRAAHPDLAEDNRAGLAASLWPGKKVRVRE